MSMGTVGVAPGTTSLVVNGQALQIADWIDDRLYSTVQFTNGQTIAIEAFTVGRGQQIAGGNRLSTRVDTNIPKAGDAGLPQDWEMYVYGICIKMTRVMSPVTASGLCALADGAGAFSDPAQLQTIFAWERVTYVEVNYNGKPYSKGTPMDYPQGRGFSLFATTANRELAQNGVPSPRDRNAMVLPIHLRMGLGYNVSFSPEAPIVINQVASNGQATNLTFADVRVDFVGLIKRTVS